MSKFDESYYLAANPDVAIAVLMGFCPSAREHYERFGRTEGRPATVEEERERGAVTKGHRREAARFLKGRGLEIGAFDSPCPVSQGAKVTYCDLWSPDAAKTALPETRPLDLVEPSVLLDVDRDGLGVFADRSQDFAIANHVLEHVANPLRCLSELLRVVRAGGHVVVSVPDHRYTVDRGRAVTPLSHLIAELEAGVTEVDPLHFVDMLALRRPDVIAQGVEVIVPELAVLKARREHAHVWDSASFRALLDASSERFGRPFTYVYEVDGEVTSAEYFAVLRMSPEG